jgi:signal transduction histidine kinase
MMLSNKGIHSFAKSTFDAVKAPWKYRTSHVALSWTFLASTALSRTQPSIPSIWVSDTYLTVFLFLSSQLILTSLWLMGSKKIISRQTRPLKAYLVWVASIVIWVFPSYLVLDLIAPDPLPTLLNAGFRITFTMFLLQVIWTSVSNQLSKELFEKERLVTQLVRQRELIIESEEETKHLVSRYLHNNLQSGLVVISHQLNELVKGLSSESKPKFLSIVDELEVIRKVEIRNASKALYPDTEVLNIETLVDPLIELYAKSMKVNLNHNAIDYEAIRAIGLPLYRICEQVLLNAAVHGKASVVNIDLELTSQDVLVISIRNDGEKISGSKATQGTGTAIIDTWVSHLDGRWKLTSNQQGQPTFQATIALKPNQPKSSA